MSPTLSRILISILLVPLGLVVYLAGVKLAPRGYFSSFGPFDSQVVTAGLATWLVIGGCWVLIWRRAVTWTQRRVVGTLLALPVAAVFGFVVNLVLNLSDNERDLGLIIASILAPTAWLMATAWIWRETTAERTERLRVTSKDSVVCPKCGYNLTGLTGATCPECGTQYTLDELYGSQRSRERTAEVV